MMTDDEKYRSRIRSILDFSTSLRARTIVGISTVLVLTCLLYVIPKVWALILNVISKTEFTP